MQISSCANNFWMARKNYFFVFCVKRTTQRPYTCIYYPMNIGDLISHNDADVALAFASATDETISSLTEQIQSDPMEFEENDDDDSHHNSGHFDLQSGSLHYQLQTADSLPPTADVFNLDHCIEQLRESKYLPLGQLKHVCEKVIEINN